VFAVFDVLFVLINGESSMNAKVFFKSSNVNEQLLSLGVTGPFKLLLLELDVTVG